MDANIVVGCSVIIAIGILATIYMSITCAKIDKLIEKRRKIEENIRKLDEEISEINAEWWRMHNEMRDTINYINNKNK